MKTLNVIVSLVVMLAVHASCLTVIYDCKGILPADSTPYNGVFKYTTNYTLLRMLTTKTGAMVGITGSFSGE